MITILYLKLNSRILFITVLISFLGAGMKQSYQEITNKAKTRPKAARPAQEFNEAQKYFSVAFLSTFTIFNSCLMIGLKSSLPVSGRSVRTPCHCHSRSSLSLTVLTIWSYSFARPLPVPATVCLSVVLPTVV
jgi:hypothetical protein